MKSIVSPAIPPSSQASLSTSLSRKLKSNGSLKGVQSSPIFPPGSSNKRKGSGIGSPEPSSPKVTCIGQVRVKGKSQRSKIDGGDEALGEFGNRNVKWVHFPFRDFACLLPCRSGFCMSKERVGESEDEARPSGCCGSVLARWVADDGAAKGREIELVVEGEYMEREVEEFECPRSYRRNLFHEIEFTDVQPLSGDSARVSICIPPKNALLLMRCRSDPVKAAALASKLLEVTPSVDEGENEEIVEKVDGGMEPAATGEDEELLIVDLGREETYTESNTIAAVLMEKKESETVECEETLERPAEEIPNSKESEGPELPNCLLLMMCEPKLSMEVSKETWVCSTDFIRWVPGGRLRRKTDVGEIPEKSKRVNPIQSPTQPSTIDEEESKPKVIHARSHVMSRGGHVAQWKLQPPRSSCHYPSQQREAMASPMERSHGFDPFGLTRCKSEPMRTALVG